MAGNRTIIGNTAISRDNNHVLVIAIILRRNWRVMFEKPTTNYLNEQFRYINVFLYFESVVYITILNLNKFHNFLI